MLVIIAFSIVATPALAFAATPPWWVTTAGAVGGGIIGTIATGGTPIGAIAGATAGALLANYIYSITQTQSKGSSGFSASQELQYLNSVTNSTLNTVLMQNASALTQKDLTETSYYYFAQLMDTVVPYFLSNNTLNETYMGWDSGLYATLDNLSISQIYPLDTILFQYYDWLASNSYPSSSAVTVVNIYSAIYGNPVKTGNYYFITPNNNFYSQVNTSFTLKNIVNGTSTTYSFTTNRINANIEGQTSTGVITTVTVNNLPTPAIISARALGIPTGEYEITSVTTSPVSIQIGGGTSDSVNSPLTTDALNITSTGSPSFNDIVTQYSMMNGIAATSGSFLFGGDTYSYVHSGTVSTYPQVYYETKNMSNINIYLTEIYSMITNSFTSANAYFNQLKSLGYNSASQVPPSLLYVTPSTFVPTSMLNSTFNATELQALYTAYLLQLKSWLNETSKHTLQANMTINNSTFDNGFVQVYGNLENNITSNGIVSHYYYNNTWFVPLINLDKWTFRVHNWTNITDNTPDPNFLIVSGSSSGTLVNVVNGTFYTDAISVNGSSTSSFTISPVTIQYVLPHTVSIGKLNNGGFLFTKTAGLQNWELILAGIITVIGIAIVFDRRD